MLQNDKKIKISAGRNRWASEWHTRELLWSEFISQISRPERTEETYQQYMALSKAQQDELKDVGGYVGGTLTDGVRKNGHVGERYLITLDADNIPAGQTQSILNAVDALGCAYAVYSTRKHSGATPRLRIVFPMDTICSADEYEPIARKMASFIGMQLFDPTTFQPVRMMYWPSCSSDSEFIFLYADRPLLSKEGILQLYQDWRSIAEWPEVPGAVKLRERSARKQGDPLEKVGVVGAFCKNYSVLEAIEEFIPGVYEQYGVDRLTYTEGSTVGGAILYEDGHFLYSHHATDPAGGRLNNAFDLIRLHLFSDEDITSKPNTPVTQLPSFKAMCEFAMQQPSVAKIITAERYEKAQIEFAVDNPEEDPEWMGKLKCSAQTGQPIKTIDNVLIILEHDPQLKNLFYHDAFANRPMTDRRLPWEVKMGESCKRRAWADEDDAGLRHYLEKVYGLACEKKTYDAMAVYATRHRKHKIKEYLEGLKWDGVPRVDHLLTNYLGAPDTDYTKAVIRKCLVAAVARAMEPGIKFDSMLILSGAQGLGKSTFFRMLGKDWYSDSLSTFEGKDAAELIQGYWLIEAGELTGMNKSEMNTIKQFLSKTEDVYREPYGRRTKPFPRSCVIVGTTNDKEFLKDYTGNRRFWPVDLGKQAATKNVFKDLPCEVDQIWAEAFVRWQCGEKLYLEGSVEAEAISQQDAHKESNPKEGIIKEFLERRVPADWNRRDLSARRDFWNFGYKEMDELLSTVRDRVCAAEIWCECFYGDLKLMKRSDSAEINGILQTLEGWERAPGPLKFGAYYGLQRGFLKKVTN